MSETILPGRFLVLDGPDGCGKSTQIELLAEAVGKTGAAPLTVRDPGGTRIGERIREILLCNDHREMAMRCEALLYMASRAQLYQEKIGPALAGGRDVISDRWISSTHAYQAAAGALGADWLERLAAAALERVWPDLTIIIDIPAEVGLQRLGRAPDRLEARPLAYHRQVRQAFCDLAAGRDDVCLVDGAGSPDQVHQRIWKVIRQRDVSTGLQGTR